MIEVYRLFRKAQKPQTLFHGVNGSRTMPTDIWIDAEIREVRNPGTKTGPTYLSGFHVGRTREEVVRYIKRFKQPDELVVCKVYVSNLRPKPRSKSNIYLADSMLILKQEWEQALGESYE